MSIDEIKRLQARIGVSIEACRNLGNNITADTLTECMRMSADYERLVKQLQAFVDKVDENHLAKSAVGW